MSLVSNLLHNGDWNTSPTPSPYLLEAWQSLHLVDRLHPLDEDRIIWMATANGKFTIKSARNLV